MQFEQRGRFLGGEGQLRVPDLRHVAGRPVTVQRQQRLGAGDEDQAHAPTRVVQDELQLVRDLRVGHPVVFVEHHHHGPVPDTQVGGESRQQRVVHAVRVRGEADLGGQRHITGAQGLEQVRPERSAPLVRRVGGEPGDGPVLPRGPVGDQQGLAGTRGSVDHGQRCPEGVVEVPDQPLPPQERPGARRQGEPGAQKRVSLGIGAWRGRFRAVLFQPCHGAHHHCSSGHGQRSPFSIPVFLLVRAIWRPALPRGP